MTTQTQANDERPIRNGARPPWYNYLLAPGFFAKHLAMGFCYGLCGSIMYMAAIAAEIVITPLTFIVWLYMTSEQARAIIRTPVGERIPAQHGFGCLRRMWLRSSPVLNLTLWMFHRSKPGVFYSPCRAGCVRFEDFWVENRDAKIEEAS